MQVVSAKQIAKALNLDKYGQLGTFIGWLFLKITRLSKLNRLYDRLLKKVQKPDALSFLNELLVDLGVTFEIPAEDLKRLPKNANIQVEPGILSRLTNYFGEDCVKVIEKPIEMKG